MLTVFLWGPTGLVIMYHQYFGLHEAPFSIAVNPRYLFMSARHRDALAHLLYGVGAGGGFILLTGEVGTGKTTINRCLLEQLPENTDIAIVLNPALNAVELLATVCDELHIDYDRQTQTLKLLTDHLHHYLLQNYQRGRKTVLLIDEAQHLDFDVLEQIRLLTNLETNSEKLLQIILIGQPELAQMLARPELRQLNQRITARYNLEPLNLEETGAYIKHRLQVAGARPDREIFPAAVVRGIYRATRGIPRVINVLCDRILLGAYGRNQGRADSATLKQAVREVLGEEAPTGAAWQWPLAIVAGLGLVVLLVVAGAQLLLGSGTQGQGPAVSAAAETPVVSSAAPQMPSAAPVQAPVAVATVAAPAEGALPDRNVALAPGESMAALWSLYGQVRNDCPTGVEAGVQCVRREAGTWDELAELERPLSLSLINSQRFAAEALLLGIEGQQAWLWNGADVVTRDLVDLAPLWTGTYRYLWRVPPAFSGPLARGDSGAAVAEVARMFARLDDQAQPLTDSIFNAALEQRVRLFQRQHNLSDDGVVGVQTLLALNAALALDPDTMTARQMLVASTPVGVVQ